MEQIPVPVLSQDVPRIDVHLAVWADWMKAHELHVGFPTKSTGFQSATSQDFEELVHAADRTLAKMIDAAIDGLSYIERCAISHKFLGTVWPDAFAYWMYVPTLNAARDSVAKFLFERGIE